MKPASVPPTVRMLAALFMLGSVVGVATPFLEIASSLSAREAATHGPWWAWVSMGAGFLMFVWGFCLGVELWDGGPRSLNWARLTFVAQIPSVGIHGIGYEFQTLGVAIRLLFVSGWRFDLHAGSNAGVGFVAFNHDLMFGVNVVAIAAAAYLNRVISVAARKAIARSELGLI